MKYTSKDAHKSLINSGIAVNNSLIDSLNSMSDEERLQYVYAMIDGLHLEGYSWRVI